MGKKGGSKVEYSQSPEQRQVYEALMPALPALTDALKGYRGLYSVPQMSDLTAKPTAGEYMSAEPGYQVPSTSSIMPTSQWWGGLAPEVKEGMWAPYNEGANQMLEVLGAGGGHANPRTGGYSGAAGSALGRFYQDAAKDVGLQAWQMTAPGAMMGWQADLSRGMLGDQRQYAMGVQDYQTAMQEAQTADARNQNMWSQQLAARQMPWSIMPGLMGGSYSNPVVTQQPNLLGGLGAGALMGGLAAATPWIGGPAAAMMGIGSFLGGM